MAGVLFQNKKKNIFVGVMAAAYLLVTLLSNGLVICKSPFSNVWYYLGDIASWLFVHSVMICVLIYLLTLKKEFRLKKWILPLGFGLTCLRSLLSFPYSVGAVSENTTLYSVIIFAFTCISALGGLLCFVGTLFDFEFLKLFRAGVLLNVTVLIVSQITETVFNAINGYFTTYGFARLDFLALAQLLILLLFYISLYHVKT